MNVIYHKESNNCLKNYSTKLKEKVRRHIELFVKDSLNIRTN